MLIAPAPLTQLSETSLGAFQIHDQHKKINPSCPFSGMGTLPQNAFAGNTSSHLLRLGRQPPHLTCPTSQNYRCTLLPVNRQFSPAPCPMLACAAFSHKPPSLHSLFARPCGSRGKPGGLHLPPHLSTFSNNPLSTAEIWKIQQLHNYPAANKLTHLSTFPVCLRALLSSYLISLF